MKGEIVMEITKDIRGSNYHKGLRSFCTFGILIAIALVITAFAPIEAYATVGQGDAFTDILEGPRYQGTVEALKGVTATMDVIFMGFISICAFFIISCALLRNVIAGVYASYPIFFDKVHDAKMRSIERAGSIGGRAAMLGSVAAFLLSMLPDIKEMSEFRDDNIQPKDYFLRAIPQCVGVVMIGVTIYNGYYRDIVVEIAKFGSTMIERVLTNTDPVQVFDNITNAFGKPVGTYDDADDSESKLIAGVSGKMYAKTISFYTDITTKAAKTSLYQNIENWTADKILPLKEYSDDTKYKVAYQVDSILGDVDLTAVNTETSEVVTKAWTVSYAELGVQSGEHLNEDWKLRVIVRFTKKHSGVQSSGTITNAQLVIPSAKLKQIDGVNGTASTMKITMTVDEMKGLKAGSGFKVGSNAAKIVSDGIEISGTIALDSNQSVSVSGLYYQDAKSASNMIKSITFTNSGSIHYKDMNGTVPDWNPGETAYSTSEAELHQDTTKEKDSNNTEE